MKIDCKCLLELHYLLYFSTTYTKLTMVVNIPLHRIFSVAVCVCVCVCVCMHQSLYLSHMSFHYLLISYHTL